MIVVLARLSTMVSTLKPSISHRIACDLNLKIPGDSINPFLHKLFFTTLSYFCYILFTKVANLTLHLIF